MIAWVQLGVLAFFAALYALAPVASDAGGVFAPVPWFIGTHIAFTVYHLHRARRGTMTPAFITVCVVVDMALLFGLIWSFHVQYAQPAAFYLKAPTFLYVFIFIGLRALGFDTRFVAMAGITAALGWLAMVLYAFQTGGERTRSYVDYLTSNHILLGAEMDKMVAVAVMTALLCFVVHRNRRLLRAQVGARREADALNAELRVTNSELREEAERRAESEQRLAEAAYRDGLTGLLSRAGFERHLAERMTRDPDGRFGVIVFDLDGFRLVNGASGYSVGDEVLNTIGARVSDALRHDDAVARLGNDEFAVFIEFPLAPGDGPGADDDAIAELAGRLATLIAEPLGTYGGVGRLSACFGLVTTTGHGVGDVTRRGHAGGARSVLRNAEIALDRAKHTSAGAVQRFHPSLRADTRERRRLEQDLADAVRAGALTMHYQPIVHGATGRPAYFEALLRWEHPERGMVSPAEFIPVAEETGMIHQLGRFALVEATNQLAEWQRRFDVAAGAPDGRPLGMSINVSTRQFERPDYLADALAVAVSSSGLEAPESLFLEMTESVLMTDVDGIVAQLERLRAMGPRLLLDDFGTGYSCFGMLPQLPLYGLKIDRSFVPPIVEPGAGRELVKSILSMARRLELGVVAEGIETEAEAAELRRLGCPLFQGYFIGRPMNAEAAGKWLAKTLQSTTAVAPEPGQAD